MPFLKYILILVLTVLFELGYFAIAKLFRIVDEPNARSSHNGVTLRGGGIIFLIGVWIYSIFFGFWYPWFLTGLTLIAGISFLDDIHSLPDGFRLIVQFIAMLLMFWDLSIFNPAHWWLILIALVVCVGIINAYNFMDGINGMTGGYSLVVLVPLIVLDRSWHFIDNNFLIVSLISVLVFCFYNFRKKAKCFAGDVGSVGIAFILLFVLGKLILLSRDFTYIIFFGIYGVDSVLTIIHRIMLHENLGKAHRKHAYQIMVNELGMPHLVVSLLYMGIQLIVSFGLLLLPVRGHWIYFISVLAVMCAAYMLFMKKFYWLHDKYLRENN